MRKLTAAVLAGSMVQFAGFANAADQMTIAVFTKNSTNPAYEAFCIAADQIAKLYCLPPSVIVPTHSITNSVSDMGLAVHVPLN